MKEVSHIVKEVAAVMSRSGVSSVVAGVSGGADSVAMLLILQNLGVKIQAVHCNFHLRGKESDRDQRFTEDLCHRLEVTLKVVHFDVESYVRGHGVSIEMACRDLRYAEFRAILSETGMDRIAVAHNADDQAETLLLNLMRGSGVAGLRAMKQDTGEIIRPLLNISRQEILRHLERRRQGYVTDSSNSDTAYRRNFIRRRVLPLLEEEWPHARHTLVRTTRFMEMEEEMLLHKEREYMEPDSRILRYRSLKACPRPDWLLHRFAYRHGAVPSQTEEMLKAVTGGTVQSGKFWVVANGRIVAERNRFEFISDRVSNKFEVVSEELSSDEPTLDEIKELGNSVLITTFAPDELNFRHTIKGDRIRPMGSAGSTLVSKIMKDAKLSLAEKERVVVAETVGADKEEREIIWVEGLKRGGCGLATGSGEKLYQYKIKRGG